MALDPPPAETFDLVPARLVVVYVVGRHQALRSMANALGPGGWLVIEDADPALQPLSCLDPETAEEHLAKRDPETVRAVLTSALERANHRLSALERVRSFVIAAEPFAISNAMLTPTLKIRRHRIREVYRDALEGLYQTRQRAAAN